MHSKFFISERPEQDDVFVAKFTKHMYSQDHKKQKTLHMMGNDPFKKSKEEMFKVSERSGRRTQSAASIKINVTGQLL